MSDFVDPLTQLSAKSDSEDEDQELEKQDQGKEEEEEPDIFDTEGKTEDKQDNEYLESGNDSSEKTHHTVKTAEEYILSDQQDLFISVEKPDKVIQSMETFIIYRVSTKTTRSSFDDCEYDVPRRYQDFVWLRGKLEESHPTHLIPPLPAKFVVKGMVDRFSSEFVGTRCRALDSFLKRIAEHPVISCNEHLKAFLTSKEFTAHRKQSKPGLLSRVSGSVKSAASVGSTLRSKGRDPEFTKMIEHVTTFREQMAVTDRVAERLLQEEKEFCNDLKEYFPTYASWAATENEVLSPIMTSLSKCLESCTESATKLASTHELYFIPPLKEYQLYCDSIDGVLRRRDAMQSQRDRLSEEIKKKKEEIGNLPNSDQSYSFGAMFGKKPDDVKQQKEERLQQQLEEVTTRYEELSDTLERANGDLRSDMERWKFNKKQDMKQIFTQLADSHITYQAQCISSWEALIPLMQGKIDFEEMVSQGQKNDLEGDDVTSAGDIEAEKPAVTNENVD